MVRILRGKNVKPECLPDIKKIYYEPNVLEHARGREILAKYPNAERTEIQSHARIPQTKGANHF